MEGLGLAFGQFMDALFVEANKARTLGDGGSDAEIELLASLVEVRYMPVDAAAASGFSNTGKAADKRLSYATIACLRIDEEIVEPESRLGNEAGKDGVVGSHADERTVDFGYQGVRQWRGGEECFAQ